MLGEGIEICPYIAIVKHITLKSEKHGTANLLLAPGFVDSAEPYVNVLYFLFQHAWLAALCCCHDWYYCLVYNTICWLRRRKIPTLINV